MEFEHFDREKRLVSRWSGCGISDVPGANVALTTTVVPTSTPPLRFVNSQLVVFRQLDLILDLNWYTLVHGLASVQLQILPWINKPLFTFYFLNPLDILNKILSPLLHRLSSHYPFFGLPYGKAHFFMSWKSWNAVGITWRNERLGAKESRTRNRMT